MRVTSLQVRSFRGFESLDFHFDPKMNVILGINGSGKSSVLDCISIMLSRLTSRICSTKGTGRFFSDKDITSWKNETTNTISITFQGEQLSWCVNKVKKGKSPQQITNLSVLKDIADRVHRCMAEDERCSIPLAVYYPVNRAVLDVPLRIRSKHIFDQLASYDQALTGARNDFRVFFEWFRNREDLENERKLERKRFKDPQLEAVRTAITSFMPGWTNIRVRRSPLRMTISKGGKEFNVSQLSDGEKCVLALLGDLARRLALANPGLDNPLLGSAVVLIDEVELHLHPGWQRAIAIRLMEIFPNCQFILTSHSPLVVSELPTESVMILNNEESPRLFQPEDSFGLDANTLLENLMGVSSRPPTIKEKLNKLFNLIDVKKLAQAKDLLNELKDELGNDTELMKAKVLIKRIELIKK